MCIYLSSINNWPIGRYSCIQSYLDNIPIYNDIMLWQKQSLSHNLHLSLSLFFIDIIITSCVSYIYIYI